MLSEVVFFAVQILLCTRGLRVDNKVAVFNTSTGSTVGKYVALSSILFTRTLL